MYFFFSVKWVSFPWFICFSSCILFDFLYCSLYWTFVVIYAWLATHLSFSAFWIDILSVSFCECVSFTETSWSSPVVVVERCWHFWEFSHCNKGFLMYFFLPLHWHFLFGVPGLPSFLSFFPFFQEHPTYCSSLFWDTEQPVISLFFGV